MSEENEYPKVVYPGGHDVKNTAAGSGVVVNSAEEEAAVLKDAPKPEAKTPGWDNKPVA